MEVETAGVVFNFLGGYLPFPPPLQVLPSPEFPWNKDCESCGTEVVRRFW